MKNEFKEGELVIDGFKIVQYLGFEEHEDDNYHRLLCLEEGEYLLSAVGTPRSFKGTDAYDEAIRLWELNIERYISEHNNNVKLTEDFIKEFKKYEPTITLKVTSVGMINILNSNSVYPVDENIFVTHYKLEKDENYKSFLRNYIEITIKKMIEDL